MTVCSITKPVGSLIVLNQLKTFICSTAKRWDGGPLVRSSQLSSFETETWPLVQETLGSFRSADWLQMRSFNLICDVAKLGTKRLEKSRRGSVSTKTFQSGGKNRCVLIHSTEADHNWNGWKVDSLNFCYGLNSKLILQMCWFLEQE